MQDLFNVNTSNDYIHPDLPQCPGSSESDVFEIITNSAAIVSGSSIVMSLNLADIVQPVEGFVQQQKILQPGEVTYIQGLTKGISTKSQRFLLDSSLAGIDPDEFFYMSADISINYYKNFRYYQNEFQVTGDYINQIDIVNAFNISFDVQGINITASYDTSAFTFSANTEGYTFDITSLDVSLWLPNISIYDAPLVEDSSSAVPAFKYPNGAMLGYVLKVTYPHSITDETLKYVNINHVPDFLVYYDTSDGICYSRYEKGIDVGQSGISCDPNMMSAGEYLDYIESNNKWEKVGPLKIWLATEDAVVANIENLITGFYIFNPQTFAVQIEYITIL